MWRRIHGFLLTKRQQQSAEFWRRQRTLVNFMLVILIPGAAMLTARSLLRGRPPMGVVLGTFLPTILSLALTSWRFSTYARAASDDNGSRVASRDTEPP